MEISEDKTIFSTGKEVYTNCGIIGLSLSDPADSDWQVSEGYDGGFGGYCTEDLTSEERVELANYMIDLWQQFKAKYDNNKGNNNGKVRNRNN